MLRAVAGTLFRAGIALLSMAVMFWVLDTFPSALFIVVLAVTCIYLAVESIRKRTS